MSNTYLKKSCDGKGADKSVPSGVKEPPRVALGERRRGKYPAALHIIRIHLQAAALLLVSVQSRNTAELLHPQSPHLHLNNKLKAVKFRHCHYQCNYIIDLKTELGKLQNVLSKMRALTSRRVCHSVPGGCGCLNLKISVKY